MAWFVSVFRVIDPLVHGLLMARCSCLSFIFHYCRCCRLRGMIPDSDAWRSSNYFCLGPKPCSNNSSSSSIRILFLPTTFDRCSSESPTLPWGGYVTLKLNLAIATLPRDLGRQKTTDTTLPRKEASFFKIIFSTGLENLYVRHNSCFPSSLQRFSNHFLLVNEYNLLERSAWKRRLLQVEYSKSMHEWKD